MSKGSKNAYKNYHCKNREFYGNQYTSCLRDVGGKNDGCSQL